MTTNLLDTIYGNPISSIVEIPGRTYYLAEGDHDDKAVYNEWIIYRVDNYDKDGFPETLASLEVFERGNDFTMDSTNVLIHDTNLDLTDMIQLGKFADDIETWRQHFTNELLK